LMTLEQASMEIDKIVLECAPFAGIQMTTFSDTLKLADGIRSLRDIFLHHPGIKTTIEAMKDTELGFLTDRSPSAVARAQNTEKKIYPYKYEEVAECCINAMLKGYRLTNNEFNVIAGKFYPAKNGKYRKIIEHEDVTDFKFTTTSPAYEPDFKHAKVKCFASWKQKGKKMSLGLSDQTKGEEDTLIFRIKVNSGMGEDAVVGKALSKLFSRVLTRIDGRVMPESTDIEPGELGEALDVTKSSLSLKPEGEPETNPYEVKEPPVTKTNKEAQKEEIVSPEPQNGNGPTIVCNFKSGKPRVYVLKNCAICPQAEECKDLEVYQKKAAADEVFMQAVDGFTSVYGEGAAAKVSLILRTKFNRCKSVNDLPVEKRPDFLKALNEEVDKRNA